MRVEVGQESRSVTVVKSAELRVQHENGEHEFVIELLEDFLNYRVVLYSGLEAITSPVFDTESTAIGGFYRMTTLIQSFEELHLRECLTGNKVIVHLDRETPETLNGKKSDQSLTMKDLFRKLKSEHVLNI